MSPFAFNGTILTAIAVGKDLKSANNYSHGRNAVFLSCSIKLLTAGAKELTALLSGLQNKSY